MPLATVPTISSISLRSILSRRSSKSSSAISTNWLNVYDSFLTSFMSSQLYFLPANTNVFSPFSFAALAAATKPRLPSSTSSSPFIDLPIALRLLCRYLSVESVSPSLSMSLSLRSLNFFAAAFGSTLSMPSPSSDLSLEASSSCSSSSSSSSSSFESSSDGSSSSALSPFFFFFSISALVASSTGSLPSEAPCLIQFTPCGSAESYSHSSFVGLPNSSPQSLQTIFSFSVTTSRYAALIALISSLLSISFSY